MNIGDLVKLRGDKTVGIILAKNRVTTKYDGSKRGKTLAMEYLVSLITNNKASWYIEDSLELVNEGKERRASPKSRRPRKE